MDCRVDHLVGGDGDGQELVGEVQTGLIVEDGRSTVPEGIIVIKTSKASAHL